MRKVCVDNRGSVRHEVSFPNAASRRGLRMQPQSYLDGSGATLQLIKSKERWRTCSAAEREGESAAEVLPQSFAREIFHTL